MINKKDIAWDIINDIEYKEGISYHADELEDMVEALTSEVQVKAIIKQGLKEKIKPWLKDIEKIGAYIKTR